MRDEDHRPSMAADQGEKHVLDDARIALVEVSRRLIGEDERGSLISAAPRRPSGAPRRKAPGATRSSAGRAHLFQELPRPFPQDPRGGAAHHGGHDDILQCREVFQEEMELEYEADLALR